MGSNHRLDQRTSLAARPPWAESHKQNRHPGKTNGSCAIAGEGARWGAMALLFQSVLAVHIAAGAVALLVFWVPLVTKKGGRTHRRAGWVYVAAAATLATTGFLSCIPLVSDGSPLRWRAGIFLAYVSVLAGANALFGVRALQTKGRAGVSRGAIDVAAPLLLVAGGVALAAFGIGQSRVLFVLFAALGVVIGVTHLLFWLTRPAHERAWFFAHTNGMGTSCITTITASATSSPFQSMRVRPPGAIGRRERLGGLLRYYERIAA